MNVPINPDMLQLARDLRGITQRQLAEATGIGQSYISKYEGGIFSSIRPEHLDAICSVLEFPSDFFTREGKYRAVDISSIFHRKRQSLLKSALNRLDAAANLLRMDTDVLFRATDVEFRNYLPRFSPEDHKFDIEDIASMVRATWGIPHGPVRNLTEYMESAGVVVLPSYFGTEHMDAVAQWRGWDEQPYPVMLLNSAATSERQRFTLAHELGHFVMHKEIEPYEGMEEEANRFASAFLMPADDFAREAPPITIEHLIQIKSSWKVSVKAMIYRAHTLGLISDSRNTSLHQQLSRAGYTKKEPFSLPAEQPKLLSGIFEFLQSELKYTWADIEKLLSNYESDIKRRYLPRSVSVSLVSKPLRR